MEKVLLVFDRLKQAFNVNVQNKKIYKMQIILAVLNTIATLILLGILYSFFSRLDRSGYNFSIFTISDLFSGIAAVIIIGIVIGLILMFFEAGLFQMYYNAVYLGETNNKDFFLGAKRYFWKFFGVNILTILMWTIFIPFYLILGLLSLGAGFTLVPIAVNIFLIMWKVSIVTDECGIICAFKNSIKFAGRNFLPLMVFVLLMMAFTAPIKPSSGGSGGSDFLRVVQNFQKLKNENGKKPADIENNLLNPSKSLINPEQLSTDSSIDYNRDISDLMNQDNLGNALGEPNINLENPYIKIPNDAQAKSFSPFGGNFFANISENIAKISGIIKIIILAVISIITIGTLVSSVIKMFFVVFFMLAMFVIYKEGFIKTANESVEVVNE